jgi:hypothetical protein
MDDRHERRMISTWCLQAVLLGLFASAYHFPARRRWAPRSVGV